MKHFLNGRVTLCCGDNRDVLLDLAENSIDSIITDPPYALVAFPPAASEVGGSRHHDYSCAPHGIKGAKWDTGEVAFSADFWSLCRRVLKPGRHLLAFGGARTYHRLACAIED